LRSQADIIASISVCGDAPHEFVAQCHKLDIATYKLVGGKAEAFDTAAHRQETIKKYIRLCQDVGYDGIDLDFEGLDGSFRDHYSAFLRATSRELHRVGKKLSICVSYMMSTRRTTSETHMEDFYAPDVVGKTCDMVRVMCYDMYSLSGEGVGPISTQPWAKDAMKFWLQYVPRQRLIMGLPAYSGDFEMTLNGKKERLYRAPTPVVPEGTDVKRVWLPYEQINMYKYLDGKARLHLFFASDVASTRAHLETADQLDVLGMAFWHYQAVTPEMWALVRQWHQRRPGDERATWWLVFP
jgi:spore germination protein YaaH